MVATLPYGFGFSGYGAFHMTMGRNGILSTAGGLLLDRVLASPSYMSVLPSLPHRGGKGSDTCPD